MEREESLRRRKLSGSTFLFFVFVGAGNKSLFYCLTMASKQPHVTKSISPVLFLTVAREPMYFFLRPGPIKRKLQPVITAGGGVLCNIQQPGAILLIDPEERSSIPGSAAHWYVSTQYIHDCVEKDQQLSLEDYRLDPEMVQKHSARLNSSKELSTGLSGGRAAYTSEDDAAILNYVSTRKAETGGNRLWQRMEKLRVTSHSWQSMKSRYRDQLAKKRPGVLEVETTEKDNLTVEEKRGASRKQEFDVQKASSKEDATPPETHSADSDLTQIDDQSIPAGSTLNSQASVSPKDKDQHINQQPDRGTHLKTVVSEKTHLQTDIQPTNSTTVEVCEPERDENQTVVSPQKQSLPEDMTPSWPESPIKSTSSKKQKEKQASPALAERQRRITRRQLELEAAEPYGKRLRSFSSSAGQCTSSPQSSIKTKSAVKSALVKDVTAEQPPPKRARGKSVAEDQHDSDSNTAQSDESNSTSQKAESKKEKRQLGILELATKEFEDESESDEGESPELHDPAETGATSIQALTSPSGTVADPQVDPESGPSPKDNTQETRASSDNCVPDTVSPDAAAAEPASVTSKAHLFIFDSESQEDDSQSVDGEHFSAASNPQCTGRKDTTLSLTQVQLEEDKKRIKELMKQTHQDLFVVTRALLRTSGDFSAALSLILNPSSVSAPRWSRHDDSLLLSADPVVRQQLQERYGEQNVAKRIVFLEA